MARDCRKVRNEMQKSADSAGENYIKNYNACSNIFYLISLQLYEEFAEPFGLWECKLAIIHCSGHNDAQLIQKIWMNIMKTELNNATGSADDKIAQVLSKIKVLAKEYKESESCFPLGKTWNILYFISYIINIFS